VAVDAAARSALLRHAALARGPPPGTRYRSDSSLCCPAAPPTVGHTPLLPPPRPLLLSRVPPPSRFFHSTTAFACPGNTTDIFTPGAAAASPFGRPADRTVGVLLGGMNRVVSADRSKNQITVQAGMKVKQLFDEATALGMSVPLGTPPAFSDLMIGGVMLTGAHGSNFGGKSCLVRGPRGAAGCSGARLPRLGGAGREGTARSCCRARWSKAVSTARNNSAARIGLGCLSNLAQPLPQLPSLPGPAARAQPLPAPPQSHQSDIMTEFKWVNAKGEVLTSARDSPEGRAVVGSIGLLGVVTEVTLQLAPLSNTRFDTVWKRGDGSIAADIVSMLRETPHMLVVWRPDMGKYNAVRLREVPLTTPDTGATQTIELPAFVASAMGTTLRTWEVRVARGRRRAARRFLNGGAAGRRAARRRSAAAAQACRCRGAGARPAAAASSGRKRLALTPFPRPRARP
jgi:hypothetical protein